MIISLYHHNHKAVTTNINRKIIIKWKVKGKSLNRVRLFTTPWTGAYEALRPWDFPGKSTGVGCLLWTRMLDRPKIREGMGHLAKRPLPFYVTDLTEEDSNENPN